MRARTFAAVAISLAAGAAALVGSAARGSSVEEPAYTVESTHGEWEVRRYPSTIQAQVTVTGPYGSAINEGFRVLAGYIFGGNAPRASIEMTAPVSAQRADGQRIAMTAPVSATAAGEEAWIVAFTMPSSWTLEMLPTPLDSRVKLVPIEGARVAARRFGGWATDGRVAEQQAALLAAVRAAGLDPAGIPTVAQYNPPWTPPPLRRNEILVDLVSLSTDG